MYDHLTFEYKFKTRTSFMNYITFPKPTFMDGMKSEGRRSVQGTLKMSSYDLVMTESVQLHGSDT